MCSIHAGRKMSIQSRTSDFGHIDSEVGGKKRGNKIFFTVYNITIIIAGRVEFEKKYFIQNYRKKINSNGRGHFFCLRVYEARKKGQKPSNKPAVW